MSEPIEKVIIYSDGGARGNPGPAATGYVIFDQDETAILSQKGETIGDGTNNQAEYKALIAGLAAAMQLGATAADCRLDSELVVRQLKGTYKVREDNLKVLIQEVFRITNKFRHVSFTHIPREKNRLADKLVNEALDGKL